MRRTMPGRQAWGSLDPTTTLLRRSTTKPGDHSSTRSAMPSRGEGRHHTTMNVTITNVIAAPPRRRSPKYAVGKFSDTEGTSRSPKNSQNSPKLPYALHHQAPLTPKHQDPAQHSTDTPTTRSRPIGPPRHLLNKPLLVLLTRLAS